MESIWTFGPDYWAQYWSRYGALLVIISVALALWLALTRAAGRARRHYHDLLRLQRSQEAEETALADLQLRLTALRLVVNAGRYAILIGAAILTLAQFNLQLGALALPAGFLGAALGFGAQGLVRDLVSGLFIIFEGQLAVGDTATINGVTGYVEEVGLRVTRLRDSLGQQHIFPNGLITNMSRYPTRYVELHLFVTIPSERDAEQWQQRAETALRHLNARQELWLGDIKLMPWQAPEVCKDVAAQKNLTEGNWLWTPLRCRPGQLHQVRDKLPGWLAANLSTPEHSIDAIIDIELVAPGSSAEHR